MSNESESEHWGKVWGEKAPETVSWFQPTPEVSLALIGEAPRRVLDVGGGASRLVDALLDRDMTVTVVDLSKRALERSQERLGARADAVTWMAGDIRTIEGLPEVDLWHDRAAFHFLVDPADQARYRAQLEASLRSGGEAIIATFAPDGPERCSGLPVRRWSAEELAEALGLELLESRRETHHTPWGSEQRFMYARMQRP